MNDKIAKARKSAWDEIPEPKASWETFKRLVQHFGLDKAKEKVKDLA